MVKKSKNGKSKAQANLITELRILVDSYWHVLLARCRPRPRRQSTTPFYSSSELRRRECKYLSSPERLHVCFCKRASAASRYQHVRS